MCVVKQKIITILQLREIGNVSGNPQSVSNYQYLSSAIRMGNTSDVYQKGDNTFYSFIFVLPVLAIITYIILILSKHKAIKKQMMKPKQHPTFAALIGLSLTITLYITVLDIIAVAMLYFGEGATEGIYISENSKNEDLKKWLSVSLGFEILHYLLGGCNIVWLVIRQWRDTEYRSRILVEETDDTNPSGSSIGSINPSGRGIGSINPSGRGIGSINPSGSNIVNIERADNINPSESDIGGTENPNPSGSGNEETENTKARKKVCKEVFGVQNKSAEDNNYWCFLLLLFIPPIWCLSSHFGFILIAWSSFVRHSKSLTLFYIFAITVMFLVMRQSYTLIVNIYYYAIFTLTEKQKKQTQEIKKRLRKQKQEKDGISVWVIVLLHGEGFLLSGFFVYLIWGLWALPVTEIVEESPVYLYDSLQVVVVVLAILVSYQLISFKENKIKKVLKEDVNKSLKKLIELNRTTRRRSFP